MALPTGKVLDLKGNINVAQNTGKHGNYPWRLFLHIFCGQLFPKTFVRKSAAA